MTNDMRTRLSTRYTEHSFQSKKKKSETEMDAVQNAIVH